MGSEDVLDTTAWALFGDWGLWFYDWVFGGAKLVLALAMTREVV